MELKQIGEALGIGQRTMRYLLEQDIVPGLAVPTAKGRGTRRTLSLREARLTGLAAVLHELGYRGEVVQALLFAARGQLRAKKPVLNLQVRKRGLAVATVVQIDVTPLYDRLT